MVFIHLSLEDRGGQFPRGNGIPSRNRLLFAATMRPRHGAHPARWSEISGKRSRRTAAPPHAMSVPPLTIGARSRPWCKISRRVANRVTPRRTGPKIRCRPENRRRIGTLVTSVSMFGKKSLIRWFRYGDTGSQVPGKVKNGVTLRNESENLTFAGDAWRCAVSPGPFSRQLNIGVMREKASGFARRQSDFERPRRGVARIVHINKPQAE